MKQSKQKQKASAHPWRENAELGVMALILALLFKAFIFEISRIPSGSMQPTLMGSPESGVFDRLAVDKLSYKFRDPERWEVVVFRHPLQQSMDMVKRLVGMPGEDFKIENGDLWRKPIDEPDAEWTVVRRPRQVQAEVWKPLIVGRPARSPWVPDGGPWLFDGRDLSARGAGSVSFAQNPIVDGYLDGYPAAMRDPIRARNPRAARSPEHPVGDLRVAGSFRPEAGCTELIATVTEGQRSYRFHFPGPAWSGAEELRIEVQGIPPREDDDSAAAFEARAESARPSAGETVDFAVQNMDDLLSLELDGEVVLELEVAPAPGLPATITLEVVGAGGEFEDVQLYRDIHYLAAGGPVRIPDGYYLMLGDNTQDSADSRDWRRIRYEWSGPDGFSESVEGNFREGESPRTLAANGEHGGLVYFVDLWGETHFLGADEARPMQPMAAPLVPRHLIRGRGFGVFWPIQPFNGIWRLAWIH